MHCEQSVLAMEAGKHTFCEIPMADSLDDAEKDGRGAAGTGVVGMVGHVRRFNPSHQWVKQRIDSGEFNIQQMDAQTYFFRRSNLNAVRVSPQLDRPSIVAPRLPHDRFVYVPNWRSAERCFWPSGTCTPRARNRDGHDNRDEDPKR